MASVAASKSIFAEDDDSRILYSGDWSVVSPWKPGEFGATAHVTTQRGASATLRFQGTGTGDKNSVVDLSIRLDGEIIESQTRAEATCCRLPGRPEFGDPLPLRFDGIQWEARMARQGFPSLPLPHSLAQVHPQLLPFSEQLPLPPLSSSSPTSVPPQPSEPGSSVNAASPSAPSSALDTLTDGRIVTKILPQDRVVTISESADGTALQTESAKAPPAPTSAQMSTGSVAAIAVSVVAALLLVGIVLLLQIRRRKRRARASIFLAAPVNDTGFSEFGSRSDLGLNGSPDGPPVHQIAKSSGVVLDTGNEITQPHHHRDLPPPAYDHTGVHSA
ncbi:hypothetical protein BKA70DRAFT_1296488 [Coprinopsis sp. MPI-PUGE-AT-0042]|nr:hypothetical protein BKA70DRAFT_1296488 [Coprinopsis sp. MPI-PUGE-AT-0042]